ncbi:MAG TPA: glycosyltransferase, partial [bacterium]|nr:glycosyltransferase [bacterium]
MAVLVPCEPGGDPSPCLAALRGLPRADRALVAQVWVARGLNPSRQRNLAAARAGADWVLFLDSDSRAQPGQIPALLKAAQALGAVAAGGPNLPLLDEPPLGMALDRVLGSWAGSMASRARYRAVGQRRACGEKELILCNLLLARKAFLAHGGFREDLYPNEENELFNRLRAAGLALAYEPQAAVRRPRRHSVGAWIQQSFRYGHGRARQIRANPYPGDLLNLLPLALPLAWILASLAPWAWMAPGLPLAYGLACLACYRGRPDLGLLLALRHHAYAAGLLAGFVGAQAPRPQ